MDMEIARFGKFFFQLACVFCSEAGCCVSGNGGGCCGGGVEVFTKAWSGDCGGCDGCVCAPITAKGCIGFTTSLGLHLAQKLEICSMVCLMASNQFRVVSKLLPRKFNATVFWWNVSFNSDCWCSCMIWQHLASSYLPLNFQNSFIYLKLTAVKNAICHRVKRNIKVVCQWNDGKIILKKLKRLMTYGNLYKFLNQ